MEGVSAGVIWSARLRLSWRVKRREPRPQPRKKRNMAMNVTRKLNGREEFALRFGCMPVLPVPVWEDEEVAEDEVADGVPEDMADKERRGRVSGHGRRPQSEVVVV